MLKLVCAKPAHVGLYSERENLQILRDTARNIATDHDCTYPLCFTRVSVGAADATDADASELDLLLMRRAPGRRLAEAFSDFHRPASSSMNAAASSQQLLRELRRMLTGFGAFLGSFHRRYTVPESVAERHRFHKFPGTDGGQTGTRRSDSAAAAGAREPTRILEHGDCQPSNVMVEVGEGRFGPAGQPEYRFSLIDIGGMGQRTADGDVQHFVKSLKLMGGSYGKGFADAAVSGFLEGYGMPR